METAIRWSPSSTADDQRFLYVDIPGKSFKLCKVTSCDENFGSLDYDVQWSRSSVPPFQAFDWSPADERLVAVGQASGEAAVLRLDDDSQNPVVFPIRNQRSCNAVAFNTQGLLAAGLDKVRNDFSLNIWNVNQRLALGNSRSFGSGRNPVEPLRKLASSEPITSVKFFNGQPDTLVAGVRGHSVRIYDLREASGSPSLQFSTRCVHNLAIDWLDENYIASCFPSNDATVCIWDRRSGFRYSAAAGAASAPVDSGPLSSALELRHVIEPKSTISSLRFSRTKRGCLGILSNAGSFRCYDIAKEYISDEHRQSLEHALGHDTSKNYPEQIYTKKVQDLRPSCTSKNRIMEPSWQRATSFDFLNIKLSTRPMAVTLLADKTVALFTSPPSSHPVGLSSKGALICGGLTQYESGFNLTSPALGGGQKVSQLVRDIQSRASSPGSGDEREKSSDAYNGTQCTSSRGHREELLSPGKMSTVQDALTWSTIPRLRCIEGYLFQCDKNKEIVSNDPGLEEVWDWIGRAQSRSKNDSMVTHGVDMNYLGVYSTWNGKLGQSLGHRIASSDLNENTDSGVLFKELVHKLNIPQGKTCRTQYPERRQLCLRICGAPESNEGLQAIVDQLVAERQHTKAAALAIFQNELKLAYMALRNNKPTQAHKLLAMVIIGASNGDTGSDWEETCAEIAMELTDPYARAILALMSNGDWNTILQEVTLPLKYRVEIALRWLPDDELTAYLGDTTLEAIRQGDVEGIVLTGLDHPAMDLFQSYINKFNDVQTPVLAMCHTVPRFIADPINKARFDAWRETYRRQMNSWKLHLNRVKFDVESGKLAVTWEGERLVKPPLQQVSLICNYCTRPLSQQDNAETAFQQSTGPEFMHPTLGNPLGSGSAARLTCPQCGRHMPRCGICSLWLGSPDPMSKAAIAEDAKKASNTQNTDEIMKKFVVFCINCNHGFHADHAKDWFFKHRICPVAECNCICDR